MSTTINRKTFTSLWQRYPTFTFTFAATDTAIVLVIGCLAYDAPAMGETLTKAEKDTWSYDWHFVPAFLELTTWEGDVDTWEVTTPTRDEVVRWMQEKQARKEGIVGWTP